MTILLAKALAARPPTALRVKQIDLRVEQIDGTKCYMTVFLSSETYGNDATVLVFNRWMRSRKHSGGWATICHTEADLRVANAPIAIALPRSL